MNANTDLIEISQRVTEVYDQLYDSGKVRHQTEFAFKLSVNRTSVRNFLNNEREPGMRFLKALHNTFKVDINWLITGAGVPFVDDESFKISNIIKGLDRIQRSRTIIRIQYIEKEDKELITLKNQILQQDLDHEKKIILELRCEGLLRNFQANRRDLSIVQEGNFPDRMSRKDLEIIDISEIETNKGSSNHQKSGSSPQKIQAITAIEIVNRQISELISGKSEDFKKIYNDIRKMSF